MNISPVLGAPYFASRKPAQSVQFAGTPIAQTPPPQVVEIEQLLNQPDVKPFTIGRMSSAEKQPDILFARTRKFVSKNHGVFERVRDSQEAQQNGKVKFTDTSSYGAFLLDHKAQTAMRISPGESVYLKNDQTLLLGASSSSIGAIGGLTYERFTNVGFSELEAAGIGVLPFTNLPE